MDTTALLNAPLQLPTDWRFKIGATATNGTQKLVVEQPTEPVPPSPRRPIHAWTQDAYDRCQFVADKEFLVGNVWWTSVRGFLYNQTPTVDAVFVETAFNPQNAQNPRLQTSGRTTSPSCLWAFIPLEKSAQHPDGPGYLQVRYNAGPTISSAEASGSTQPPLTESGLNVLESRYLSIDPTADWGQVCLVRPEDANKSNVTWQLYRQRQRLDQQPPFLTENMNHQATSWAAANMDGKGEAIYVLNPGSGSSRICKATRTLSGWTYELPFGRPDDLSISGYSNKLYSLTSSGEAYEYTQDTNTRAVNPRLITNPQVPLLYLGVDRGDGTILGIASGTNAGKVYNCTTFGDPPAWTCVTDGLFYAQDVVGNQSAWFAISSRQAEYGDAGAIFTLENQGATLIGDASMNVQSLLLTETRLLALTSDNKCYAYNGTPLSWTDLTATNNRPWGGISGIVEDPTTLPGDNGRWFQALSGDGCEIVRLGSDGRGWYHLYYVNVSGAKPVLAVNSGTVFQKDGDMFFLRRVNVQ